jgi:hypothetical protein
VAQHLIEIGKLVITGWQQAAKHAGINLSTGVLPSLAHFSLLCEDELDLTTLFTQLMLERGYLAYSQFKPSYSHQRHHVEKYKAAVDDVFAILAGAIARGCVNSLLKGPSARRGFYRLT